MFKWRQQAGDTIVEVLIVLAVLSLAFTVASGTATRGLGQSRNAQEHSQAQGILNSQMELARKAVTNGDVTLPTTGSFCLKPTGSTIAVDTNTDNCKTTGNVTYTPSIRYVASGSSGSYEFTVTWPGTNGTNQRELMTYKVYPLANNAASGVSIADSQPTVSINVVSVKPYSCAGKDSATCTTNPAPASLCNDASQPTTGLSGVANTLDETDPTSQRIGDSTTASGSSLYTNVTAGHSYKASIGSIPSGYTACAPPAQTVTPVAPNVNPSVTYRVIPKCSNTTGTNFGKVIATSHIEYNQVKHMVAAPVPGAVVYQGKNIFNFEASKTAAPRQVIGGVGPPWPSTMYVLRQPISSVTSKNGWTYYEYFIYLKYPDTIAMQWDGTYVNDPNDTTGHVVIDSYKDDIKYLWQCTAPS